MNPKPEDEAVPSKPPADAPPVVPASSLFEAINPVETQDLSPHRPKLTAPAPPAPKDAAPLPRAFGRYGVTAILGSGGFGTVYLGHDHQLDRAVAIKVHRTDRQYLRDQKQAFLGEARRLAKLKHPGIVAVHDFGEEGEHFYIISDFVQGTTLKERLRKQPLTWQEGVAIAAAIADALAHAHAQRTIHRDLKPDNIILTADLKPIVVDFGLGIDESELTGRHRGLVAGTPAYMSPEQTAGQGHRIDGRTDIYAVGVILYELVTGYVPFRAANTDELFRMIRDDDPQPPRQLVSHIPRALELVILKAMARRVSDRHLTAGDLAEDLWKLLAQDAGGHGADSMAGSASVPSPPSGLATVVLGSPPSPAGASSGSGKKSTAVSARSREAERRQLTLLACSCDLFESAEYLENLEIEDQHDILTTYQQLCAGVIKRHDGVVLQTTDQGMLACFGYPVAFEDAAVHTVRAGLALLNEIAPLKEKLLRERNLTFTTTVQLHTGMAIVSDTPEGQSRESFSVVGDVRNVISRLQGVGRPDVVVLSQSTYRLVQGVFLCESLGNSVVKGVAKPLEFFQVLREREVRGRIEVGAPTGLSPLIGRDREVGLLQDRWEHAVEGNGQIVLIIGEAGLGKSRLVYVMKEYVAAEARRTPSACADEHPIVEWRCAPHHENSGLYSVIDYFERRLRFERDDTPERKFEKLHEHLQALGLANPEVEPFLAALLSLPVGNQDEAGKLSPARHKEKTLDAILAWLRVTATRQPFLFVIEDLHWMDPSTLELLSLHVESGLNDRILTLLTFRPEFETPWKSKGHQTVMALTRLTRRQITTMMQQRTGVAQLPPALVEQVIAKTDGVPLFVEEYTKMVMESDKLKEVQGHIEVSGSFVHQQIPATLQDLLMARLDRMGSDRDVAQIAATLGREFSYELLRTVTPLDEADLQQELEKLVTAELLFQKGKPPQSHYVFKHALIQDAAYLSMLKTKKQSVHRRVAEALEQQFAELAGRQPEVVAHHFTEAGLVSQGVAYWTKAGQRSMERSANAEAASHLRRGLALLLTLPETPERAAQELGMRVPLGTVLIASQGYAAPEVGPVFVRARELCLQIGQPHLLLAVLWGTWAWHLVREELDACTQLADEVERLAESQTDDGIRMEAQFVPALTLFYRGQFAKSVRHSDAGLALYDEERCKVWSRHTGQNAGVTFRTYRALALWCLGYPDQALRAAQDAVQLARTLAHPFSQCYAHHHLGWLQQWLRQGAAVQASADANLAVANEQGFAFWKAVGTLCKAAGALLQDQPALALEQVRQGLAIFHATGAALSLAHYHGYLAEAHGRLGRHDDALTSVEQAIAFAGHNHSDFFLAELHRLKGEIVLARSPDHQAAAEACFRDALAIAVQQEAKSWELRTTMSLCRLWHRQGRRAEARARLASVVGWFTEGLATPDLMDAKALLEEWA